MEFGVFPELHIYAGGLGILSGDILKGASDLNLNMIGIGLLYKYGNFKQKINENKEQEEYYEKVNVSNLKKLDLIIEVDIGDRICKIITYELRIGKSELFLLSSDTDENNEELRKITYHLYPSDPDTRISQEIILGVGGERLMEKLGIKPVIYHLNEGHVIFVIIERLRKLLKKGYSFEKAREVIKNNTLFTTHTPEIAGNENFEWEFVENYMKPYFKDLNINLNLLKNMGFDGKNLRIFWFPVFAMNFSKHVNGVSLLHKKVSEKMWQNLDIKIDHVTNGIHDCWISDSFKKLFKKYDNIDSIPYDELWKAHLENKKRLVEFIEEKTGKKIGVDDLIITYARRIVLYKRPYLIFFDMNRLKKILDKNRIKIIISGKAHPSDMESKSILKEILNKIKDYGLEDKIIFIENYDMKIAGYLVQGSDVWLNNPIKYREASGTSGMKACINGAVHLSTLDGWWYEAYKEKNGFKIDKGEKFEDPDKRDKNDAEDIYENLEKISEIYFKRNKDGLPEEWINIMRESIKTVKENFLIKRVLEKYVEKFYKLDI